jgi:hypothetical protein
MTGRLSWIVPWIVLIAWAILYGVAFLLPAADLGVTDDAGRRLPPFRISTGWSAFNWAYMLRNYLWLANPLVWLAALLLVLRFWRWAAVVALAAGAVAYSAFIREFWTNYGTAYLIGYWLWTVSMFGLGVSALVGACTMVSDSQSALLRPLFQQRAPAIWGASLGVVALWAGGIGLWYATAGGDSRGHSQRPRWDEASNSQYVPFYLAPISSVDVHSVPSLEQTWEDLFAGMAADPESGKLFQKLCHGANVHLKSLVVADPDEERKAQQVLPPPPPADQPSGYLELRRTATVAATRGGGTFVNCVNVQVCWSLYLYLGGHPLQSADGTPEVNLILLLVNDYLLRHEFGCQLRHGSVPEQQGPQDGSAANVIPGTPTEIRAELDQQIASFTAQFKNGKK